MEVEIDGEKYHLTEDYLTGIAILDFDLKNIPVEKRLEATKSALRGHRLIDRAIRGMINDIRQKDWNV